MTTERDIHNQIAYARDEGREEGRDEGSRRKALEMAGALLKLDVAMEGHTY
jgi:hypothetical protein